MAIDRISEEQTILTMDRAFLEAFLNRDVAVVERDLPDDFIAIFPNGVVADKQTELNNVANAKVKSYSIDEVELHWYSDTVAVVHFLMTLTMTGMREKKVRDLHVYLKRDEKWQMITGQVTPVL
ncbi:hypothetical protein S7335_815 [Synechococcus sp. PCC 7335]|uniref:nuclear transport factor 2 family protein n=1 Tax=Synechococcus sp. (strain ATCC 29403 / PCC 7335) TaxID=91464 RepID=UPI00017EC0DF|nr:nuclear transport factor 2 family protein [Synechococcus sp. PCC 7335]EDX82369.1 hypothetical protein S7335_815 [Synechococcus sp. PCC 7335]